MFSFLPGSLQNPFFITEILVPIILILLDVVSGIASALKHGDFNGKMVSDFLGNDVLRYIIAIVVVYTAYNVSGSAVATTMASTFGLGALGISTATSVYQNCRELFTPTGMALLDQAGALLGYPDPGAGVVPTAVGAPSPSQPPVSTPLGAFVDQRPTVATPPPPPIPAPRTS